MESESHHNLGVCSEISWLGVGGHVVRRVVHDRRIWCESREYFDADRGRGEIQPLQFRIEMNNYPLTVKEGHLH